MSSKWQVGQLRLKDGAAAVCAELGHNSVTNAKPNLSLIRQLSACLGLTTSVLSDLIKLPNEKRLRCQNSVVRPTSELKYHKITL